jgi:hypothetical protein
MANLHRDAKVSRGTRGFRPLPDLRDLSDEILKDRGYYRGFTCPHNHTIRDQEEHWCYFCVKKILCNVCGFDINYLNSDYKFKYHKLWALIQIGPVDECWEIKNTGTYVPKRFCFPSYRSAYSKQKAENVTFHKAIYQCTWGDIGSNVVTRLCDNPLCGNPLHLVSSWNREYPPKTIHPLCLEFDPNKLMFYGKHGRSPVPQEAQFKHTIANPLKHKEIEE